ncbi:MAG: sigma-70 family RNA polymerase sigma factor [Verrucomicrobiales bacterium]|nr:sigma-70 family RNA polymerase sigma factor [Verrucomicrobiales bacterium]
MARISDYSQASDDELVKAARGGDRGAFEELVARHRDKIHTRAWSMVRSRDDAYDLSQETWIKAWQRLEQFHGDSSFATWVTRIAINVCLDHLRRQKRAHFESTETLEETIGGVERLLPPVENDPLQGLEREELRDRIDAAMAQLTDPHRLVLVLHEFEGLEYKEVARRMKCSIGTVMSRLFYARRRLATLLAGLKEERKP